MKIDEVLSQLLLWVPTVVIFIFSILSIVVAKRFILNPKILISLKVVGVGNL